MNPLITLLLGATNTDRDITNYLSARQNPIASGAGRVLNSILNFEDRVENGAQNLLSNLAGRFFGSGQGAPLPGWMEGANLGPPRELGFPDQGYTPPDFSGLTPRQGENNLYGQGQGMMRASRGQRSGVGTRGGHTMASDAAAQQTVSGWRDSANQALLNNAQRAYQARAQTIMR